MRYHTDLYPQLREVMAAEYREAPPGKIKKILEETLGTTSPEDVEDFLGTLGSILPVIGAALGSFIPIPGVGTALGGAAGTVAGKAVASARKPGHRPRSAAHAQRAAAPAPGPPSTAGGSGAAAQLLALLFRPEVIQALIAMMLREAGRRHIMVGELAVPPAAFANLLGVRVNQAAAEYNAKVRTDGEAIPEYLLDSEGEFKCDITVPEQRAEELAKMLQAQPVEEAASLDESQYYLDPLRVELMFADQIANDSGLTGIYEPVYEDDDETWGMNDDR